MGPEEARAFACLREGTEILRTGGGTTLTAAQCNLILDAFAAQARVIEAARLAVIAYPCHTQQLGEALAMLEAEGTE